MSLFDTEYLVVGGAAAGKPMLKGRHYSLLWWTGDTWTLQYLPGGGTARASMVRTLPGGQFTCDDGSCVAITQRCDLLTDCPDYTDEVDCHIVQVRTKIILPIYHLLKVY
ncbi:Low-density lipoprotein receptor-related protein [Chionoecetes opilio]|uniref:Low-density lipoprotein receptor-related protein n=1 Tax=Chionoecetes opilio TaxID=41210 RepID=A0A8J5CFE5_CHIOP|nr:Low-density lipoprotein receptor-related protein [Chionoecetes opilio]